MYLVIEKVEVNSTANNILEPGNYYLFLLYVSRYLTLPNTQTYKILEHHQKLDYGIQNVLEDIKIWPPNLRFRNVVHVNIILLF